MRKDASKKLNRSTVNPRTRVNKRRRRPRRKGKSATCMRDLTIYLNDHLAGSIGAMEMVEDLIETHRDKPLELLLKTLKADIQSDQRDLKLLMEALGVKESKVRKAGAWMAEKASRLKLRVADFGEPDLALLQSLETLSIGIMGKRLLWRTLEAAIAATVRAAGLDLTRLERRAVEQFELVEKQAFKIAQQIFVRDIHGQNKSGGC